MLNALPTEYGIALVVLDYLLRIIALGVIPGNRRPSVGMAWLLLVMFVPTIGIIAFALLGSNKVGRSRTNRQEKITNQVRETVHTLPKELDAQFTTEVDRTIVQLGQTLGGFPATEGNAVVLHCDYDESLNAMAETINRATDYVHVEFYILAWDESTAVVFDALTRAAARGVKVYLLFDHVGSMMITGYKKLGHRLTAAGISWHRMLPIRPLRRQFRRPDLRNHRKILVVDGTVAFMGSQNLIGETYGKKKNRALGRRWVDAMCEIRGPAVTALDVVFAADWLAETGNLPWPDDRVVHLEPARGDVTAQVLPSGPGYAQKNNLRLFTSLIHSATQQLRITSPYFVPDESLLHAVTSAALRGVDVELFVSEEADQFMVHHAQCSYYRELLRSGVRIWLYPPPKVLHSKFFTVDDRTAVFGSSNMDMRSFALNYEISMVFVEESVVEELNLIHDQYREVSRELTLTEWLQRPPLKRYVDNVMRLTAELQ